MASLRTSSILITKGMPPVARRLGPSGRIRRARTGVTPAGSASVALRAGPGGRPHGPPPDSQLERIIEVMLCTSARIGEMLSIHKCDVDVTVSQATARIYSTLVSRRTDRLTGRPRSRHVWCLS